MWPQQIISPLTGLFLPMSFSQFRIIFFKKNHFLLYVYAHFLGNIFV